MNKYLISDPAERTARARQKEEWVLDFLRDEVYSSTAILADVMAVGVRAARTVLNRMEKKGLLIKDNVEFMGMKALPLWGITTDGIFEYLTEDEVKTVNLRVHKKGRVSPVTIAHTLDTQKIRLYCEVALNFDMWIPDRLIEGKGLQKSNPLRWPHYPDAIGMIPTKNDNFAPIAIEAERTRKAPERYVYIIKCHLDNIQKRNYVRAWYFCPNQVKANNLKALFLRIMTEKNIGFFINDIKHSPEDTLKLFSFKGMEVIK